jgi:hypothetical protein
MALQEGALGFSPTDSLKFKSICRLGRMVPVEECLRRADEYARLAEQTVNSLLIARYRQLEAAWRYLAPEAREELT